MIYGLTLTEWVVSAIYATAELAKRSTGGTKPNSAEDLEKSYLYTNSTRTHLVLLILFKILARFLLEYESRARERRRAVPGQRRTRRTRRRHRQRVKVPVQQIPVATIVVVIPGTELYVIETDRFPVFR